MRVLLLIFLVCMLVPAGSGTSVGLTLFTLTLAQSVEQQSNAEKVTARSRLGAVRHENKPTTEFSLTDQNGKPFHLSQLRSKAVLLFFGYTHCPDACPTTMAKLSRVFKQLGADADKVVVLFISVDPARDTFQRAKKLSCVFSYEFDWIDRNKRGD